MNAYKLLTVGVGTLVLSLVAATPVQAKLAANGISMNGLTYNGLTWNDMSLNGLTWNGLGINGQNLNGVGLAAEHEFGALTVQSVTLPTKPE